MSEACALDKYLAAVSKRKSLNRKMSGYSVNMAVLLQLERHDIPLMLEIIESQCRAIKKVIDLIPDDDEEAMMSEGQWRERVGEMGVIVAEGHLHVDQLAQGGSAARWGGTEEDDGLH